jgi:hypothetical protein
MHTYLWEPLKESLERRAAAVSAAADGDDDGNEEEGEQRAMAVPLPAKTQAMDIARSVFFFFFFFFFFFLLSFFFFFFLSFFLLLSSSSSSLRVRTIVCLSVNASQTLHCYMHRTKHSGSAICERNRE